MKQTINLTNFHKDMIVNAMGNLSNTLNGMGKQIFDIAFTKVRKADKQVELDGMEMIFVTQALRLQSKQLAKSGVKELSHLYRVLGDQVEEIRVSFQNNNSPLLVNKKKAASAVTLTA